MKKQAEILAQKFQPTLIKHGEIRSKKKQVLEGVF